MTDHEVYKKKLFFLKTQEPKGEKPLDLSYLKPLPVILFKKSNK